MNEEIRKLAIETDVWCDQHFPDDSNYNIKWEQKFAELIIQECVAQCESVAELAEITNLGEMARKTKATAESCGKMIKMRFGVTE
jgi:hypothetical protein